MLDFSDIQKLDTAVLTPGDVARKVAELQSSINSSPAAFIDCGSAFLSFGMLPEAWAAYSEAVTRDSESVKGFLGRAQAGYGLMLACEDEERIATVSLQVASDFRRVLKLTEGRSREAILGLGSVLLAANRFAECSNWIEEQLRDHHGDRNHEGDLLYLYALCRLFAGDVDQAIEYADKMDRVAGFEGERFFICGFVSWLKRDHDQLVEYRAALLIRDAKLAQVLGLIEAGAKAETYLDLARLLTLEM